MSRRDTYPTVTVRKQADKYRRLPDYLTDSAINTRLTPRQLKRLNRAVRFDRDCRQVGFGLAKDRQTARARKVTGPWETVEITGASLGESTAETRIVLDNPRKLAYYRARAELAESEPALNVHDSRPRPARVVASQAQVKREIASGELDRTHSDSHLGNTASQGRTVDNPDSSLWDSVLTNGQIRRRILERTEKH